jgi:hypothetical protein
MNFPEMEPLSPNAEKCFHDLARQQQAAPTTSTILQPSLPSNQYPRSPAVPPSAPTSRLQKPPTDANPAFQSYFFGQGQQLHHNIDQTFFPSTATFHNHNLSQDNQYQFNPVQFAAASHNFDPSQDNQYQFNPATVPFAAASSDPDQTQPQGLPSVAGGPSASYTGPSSPVDATTIAPTTTVPPLGTDGLRLESYEAAFVTVDPMFRDPVTIKDDDVFGVVQDKRRHVKLLVDAMKHGGCMTAVDYKKTEQGRNQAVDAQAFDYWQNGASEIVKAHLTMPRVDEKIECVAWEIFENFLRVHRTGFRFTKETADIKTKCSKRIEDTVRVIKGFALVRQKLLERGNIHDLATNPMAFVSAIAQYHRNNYKRPKSTVQNRRGAKAEGAIGKAYMSRAEYKDWIKATKAEAKVAGGNRATNVNGQQESRRKAAMNTIPASGSTPEVEEGSNTLMANNQEVQRPPALLILGMGASLLEPTQPQGYEAAGPPRFGIDHFFDFDRDLGAGFTGNSMSHGGFDHGVRDGASFGDFTFEDPINGTSFSDQQAPRGAQYQSRGGGDPSHPSQLAAVYGSYDTLADVGATGSSQIYGAAPGAAPNKRRRTDSAAVFEDAWYGAK